MIDRPLIEFAIQPRLRGAPIAENGGRGDIQGRGRLFHAETAKKTELDDSALSLFEDGKSLQRFVQFNQI